MSKWILNFFLATTCLSFGLEAGEDVILQKTTSISYENEILDLLKSLEGKGYDLGKYGRQYWFIASKLGYESVLSFLVHDYIDVNLTDDGMTALHLAAKHNCLDCLELLLDNNAKVDFVSSSNYTTPLMFAAYYGNTEILTPLIESGASVSTNRHALVSAASKGHLDVVLKLLDFGFEVDGSTKTEYYGGVYTALHAASKGGYSEVVEALVFAGADLEKTYNGRTPLQLATENGNFEVVRILIDAGAKINDIHRMAFLGDLEIIEQCIKMDPGFVTSSENGMTALHYAACSGSLEVVDFLISKGVGVDAMYYKGISPLHIASLAGHLEVAKKLIDAGADTDSICRLSSDAELTPLFFAAGRGHIEIIEFLIENGATVNSGYNFRFEDSSISRFAPVSELYYAIYNGQIDAVRSLVGAGANVNVTSMGWSSLHFAAEGGHIDILQFLLEAGASVDQTENENKRTPLHLAAKNGLLEVVEVLVSAGAEISRKDSMEKTALMLAAEQGYFHVVDYLNSL